MNHKPAFDQFPMESTPSQARVPLLCWDIAHPLVIKRQQVASDLDTFGLLQNQYDWQFTGDLRPLLLDNLTVIVTDRTARIVWVSAGFRRLTGHEPGEVLGKSPAMFQGALTSPRTKALLRQKLACAESIAVKIRNYRKGGTSYWCQIKIEPLFNGQQECTHFIAIESEIERTSSVDPYA